MLGNEISFFTEVFRPVDLELSLNRGIQFALISLGE